MLLLAAAIVSIQDTDKLGCQLSLCAALDKLDPDGCAGPEKAALPCREGPYQMVHTWQPTHPLSPTLLNTPLFHSRPPPPPQHLAGPPCPRLLWP